MINSRILAIMTLFQRVRKLARNYSSLFASLSLLGCFQPEKFEASLDIKENWDYHFVFHGQIRTLNIGMDGRAEAQMVKNYRKEEGVTYIKKIGLHKYEVAVEKRGNLLKKSEIGNFLSVQVLEDEVRISFPGVENPSKFSGHFIISSERDILKRVGFGGQGRIAKWLPKSKFDNYAVILERRTDRERLAEEERKSNDLRSATKFTPLSDFAKDFKIAKSQNSVLANKEYIGKRAYIAAAASSIDGDEQSGYSISMQTEKILGMKEEGALGTMAGIFTESMHCDVSRRDALKYRKGDLVEFSGIFHAEASDTYLFKECAIRKTGASEEMGLLTRNFADQFSRMNSSLKHLRPVSEVKRIAEDFRIATNSLVNAMQRDTSKCNYAQFFGGTMDAIKLEMETFPKNLQGYYAKYPEVKESVEFIKLAQSMNRFEAVCLKESDSQDPKDATLDEQ